MENRSDTPTSETRPTGIGLGERLQAARIKQGLSVEDIAGRMHLNVQIVKAIEENNFDDITAPIFVKGYLRAYARILSLDEEEVIQHYADYYSHEDPPITTTSHLAPELSVADVRIKWTTYLVIIGLAALLAAWWWNKNQDEATPISLDSPGSSETVVQSAGNGSAAIVEPPSMPGESATQAAEQDLAENNAAAIESAESPQPETDRQQQPVATQAEAPQAEAAEPVAVQPPAPSPTAPQQEGAANAGGETQAQSTLQAAAETPAEITVAASADGEQNIAPAAAEAEIETAAAPVRLGAPILVAPTGSDILSLTFTADSWADVKDGEGFQMVYHLLRAGQSLELKGSAPFSVFLGNGPGVEVRFNGEPVEFSTRVRGDNTAFLKLGG